MELATEHVRMLDAGRQRVAYSSPLSPKCFDSVYPTKTQLLQHGNTFGFTFVSTEKGFAMTKNDELETSSIEYMKCRQEALDHGQKLSLEEIQSLPLSKEIQLPSIAYWIALSPDELMIAVAYGDSIALFEVAHVLEAITPAPFHIFSRLQAHEMTWCAGSNCDQVAVLTLEKQVMFCSLDGRKSLLNTPSDASSISWSPSGDHLAVGFVNGTIAIYEQKSLQIDRTISQPPCCADAEFEVHHVHWVEDELILAGYHKYDDERDETTAFACLFERGKCFELDEVVGYVDVESRRHQYFSVFLPEWRMFFIGCSLSADIELLVADPDGGEWGVWKPLEKYQARLPMNAQDEESFLTGLTLNLNSTTSVAVDDEAFSPVPVVSCATTEGLLIHFAFVDTTVNDVEFVKRQVSFHHKATRVTTMVTKEVEGGEKTAMETMEPASERKDQKESVPVKRTNVHDYGQNDENEFAESDHVSRDDEEERKEEEDKARASFRLIASDGADFILSEQFPKLFKALGSTYSEEEHASTLEKLEKDGKIYETDFVAWYVDWIFGDDDVEFEDDAPSTAEPSETKSKEEIEAVLSKFKAKEGSWKCDVCMVTNDREATKCSACEAPNPAAPKGLAAITTASAPAPGSIGSEGFSFPLSTGDASKSSSTFPFGAASSSVANVSTNFSGGFPFGGTTEVSSFSLSSCTTASGPDNSSSTAAKTENGDNVEKDGDKAVAGDDVKELSNVVSVGKIESKDDTLATKEKQKTLHEYGQSDENEYAESDGEESDEEEERLEEEANARRAFRSVVFEGAEFITKEQFPKLFKALGSTYSDEKHASALESLEKGGKVYEIDFIAWYVDWIFDDADSSSDNTSASLSPRRTNVHDYGQNDENEFAESDHVSSDDEEERKEEEDKARASFHLIASDGADFILSEQFPKLFKALGSTYSEEEHASTLEKLEKDGKIYETDFVSWYVDWIFGDDDVEFEDNAPSTAETSEAKSKEEIAAVLSKFKAKEGSWKCDVCMVTNDREATKCSACEAPNPAAPKGLAAVTTASAPAAGSIGSEGFSFPLSTGDASKSSSTFPFGAASSSVANVSTSFSGGFPFGGTTEVSSFSFSSSTAASGPSFGNSTSAKPDAGSSFGATENSIVAPSSAESDTNSSSTMSKSKLPASGGYPPDTTSKPKPPAFGAANSAGYPPNTTSKPKPPVFGVASSGGYPPDTTSKPQPPAFGSASAGSYPPDTTSKPKPPAFGAANSAGYPPNTTSKPKPPAFGGVSSTSSYPPDTTSKPKPPVFGAASSSSGNPSVSTSKPMPTTFGQAKPQSNVFGSGFGTKKAVDSSSSPFGVVPTGAFSMPSFKASDSKDVAKQSSTARPIFSFDSLSSTLETSDASEDHLPTKRTLNFAECSASKAPTASVPRTAAAKSSKGMPSSQMEGQLWQLIVDFDKSLKRVNESSTKLLSKDPAFSKTFVAKLDKLRTQLSDLCDRINDLDALRDELEKNVLFVIGSDGDVHEQLEYSREILKSFNDEALKRTLEAQPLDQRSKETWESLKKKLKEVETCCRELERHVETGESTAMSSTHLFRVLKQTYDTSKLQYDKVCKLTEQLDKLTVGGDRRRPTNGLGVASVDGEAPQPVSKAEMMQMILENEQRSQDVRRRFLTLCNNVVTPRDVFLTPRRKVVPPTSSTSPKACSKLMPKTQLSVASPMSSAKRAVTETSTSGPLGSKLLALAEAMTPRKEPAKIVQSPHVAKSTMEVGKAPQRPSLGVSAAKTKPASTTSASGSSANVFSFADPFKKTEGGSFPGAVASKGNDTKTASITSSSSGVDVTSTSVKSKPTGPNVTFSLGGKSAPGSASAFTFGGKDTTTPLQSTPNYRALLETFYKVHNPSKTVGGVIEKALVTYKGREMDLFTRLFSMYVPESTPEDIKKYINGGPVPPKRSESGGAPSTASTSAVKSPFGKASTTPTSPFGASPSSLNLGAAVSKPSGFSAFGSTAATAFPTTSMPSTPFGKPAAVDYRQKLIEFYQKHNPEKLSSVDTTLQKYKGNEAKLFQNLAAKYKVNDISGTLAGPPASPAVQPTKPNAAASPFGKPGAFSAPSASSTPTFGAASLVGYGDAKPSPAASPFGTPSTPASSPFGTQPVSGFGFQSTSASTPQFGAPSPFGITASGFNGATSGVNYREKLVAFYQQHNPSKLNSVDTTLEKYRGREEHLFAMLEQKYLKKTPTAATSGGFGIPSTSTFGTSTFGAPSSLGGASATPAFGSASTLGNTGFGGTPGAGFGMTMGGGFNSNPSATSGATSGSGFGAFGSQTPSFSSMAQQSPGFGANTATAGGFGSTPSGFGQPATASFTQMRSG